MCDTNRSERSCRFCNVCPSSLMIITLLLSSPVARFKCFTCGIDESAEQLRILSNNGGDFNIFHILLNEFAMYNLMTLTCIFLADVHFGSERSIG